jgi:hypothetical protein
MAQRSTLLGETGDAPLRSLSTSKIHRFPSPNHHNHHLQSRYTPKNFHPSNPGWRRQQWQVSPEFRSSLTPPEELSGFPSGTDQASDQRHLVQREQMSTPKASTELLAYPLLKVAQHPGTQLPKQPLSGKFRSYAEVVGASWKPPSQLPPMLAPPMSQ